LNWFSCKIIFYQKYAGKDIYLFTNINSTKVNFITLNTQNIDDYLLNYVLSPYGVLFYKHNDKLAYTVKENIAGLKRRKKEYEIIEDGLIFITKTLKKRFPNIKKIKLEILKPSILENVVVGAEILKKY